MRRIRSALRRLGQKQDGATAIEYGLIAGLLGLALIGGLSAIGTNINNVFNRASSVVASGASS